MPACELRHTKEFRPRQASGSAFTRCAHANGRTMTTVPSRDGVQARIALFESSARVSVKQSTPSYSQPGVVGPRLSVTSVGNYGFVDTKPQVTASIPRCACLPV